MQHPCSGFRTLCGLARPDEVVRSEVRRSEGAHLVVSVGIRTRGQDRVEGAADTHTAPVQHMCVDHGRLYAPVAKELLDGPDVVAIFEQVSCEAVSEGVTGHLLGDAAGSGSAFHGALNRGRVSVKPPQCPRLRISDHGRGREDELPTQLRTRPW